MNEVRSETKGDRPLSFHKYKKILKDVENETKGVCLLSFQISMFNIKEELKKLPEKPGVYIMRDKDNNILYVGKAVILKNRVKQYFNKTNKTARIEKMVSLIDYFEYIVTDNEAEALILECNLIKKNMPKFNVLLKDDKTYPYIKIDIKSDYPKHFV